MSLRGIFKSWAGFFRYASAQDGKTPHILICNDFDKFHDQAKTIGRHLRAMKHDIRVTCLDDESDLLRFLAQVRKNGGAPPNAFFLDVGGLGKGTAEKVIKWFEENRPDLPLPDIHFLSQDNSMALDEATRMRESDSRIMADFVDREELEWVEDYLAFGGESHPHRATPASATFRLALNRLLGVDLPLEHSESAYAAEIKKLRGVTNNDVIAAWQKGKLTAAEVVERLRNYAFGVAGALQSGFYAEEGMGSALKPDARFYGSAGFPLKGPVAFSLEDVRNAAGGEKPVLVMRGYDPEVVPLLAGGKLGGLVVTSTYMASHLRLLCETHMVSGLFGLIPPGKKTLKREFNEVSAPVFPAYFEGETAEIGGHTLKKGQEILIGIGEGGLALRPPEDLQVKPFDLSGIDRHDKLRADLTNLQKINECFAAVFKEKGMAVSGVKANIDSSSYRVLGSVKGIGLVRTEQMVAASSAQAEALKSILLHNDDKGYARLCNALKWDYMQICGKLKEGSPVKIRLFDFVHQEILDQEEQRQFLSLYPKLDMHGGEALAAWPRLYREQVRTIFQALKYTQASGSLPLEIMMPAVRTEEDVLDIKAVVQQEAEKAGLGPEQYSFGVMVETLEACGNISAIAPHCDFISFGTNDLTQQHFNMARSDLKAHAHFAEKHGFDPFKKLAPEILELVASVTSRGRQANPALKVDVCGAQAADPETAAALARVGVDNISVAPSLSNLYALPLLLNYKVYDTMRAQSVLHSDIKP